jgi:hypothetical protein
VAQVCDFYRQSFLERSTLKIQQNKFFTDKVFYIKTLTFQFDILRIMLTMILLLFQGDLCSLRERWEVRVEGKGETKQRAQISVVKGESLTE